MRIRVHKYLRFICLSIGVLISLPSLATTIDDLIESGQLALSIEVVDQGDYVVGQELTVNIRIATQTWFKGANKFTLPEVNNAVVIQRDSFGTNSSQRIKGVSWVVQEKRFSVFPQTASEFTIPAMAVNMKVFVPGEGDVEGTGTTKPINFSVGLPAGLENVEQWWAAKNLTISQTWDKDFAVLKPGYAIKRTITIEADGVLAMMLPEVNHAPIAGFSHYLKTPQLADDNVRGNKIGKRIQVIDYVVEESGEVIIPSVELTWWNIDNQSVEYARLPEQIIQIGDLSAKEKLVTFYKQALVYWPEILVALVLLIGTVWGIVWSVKKLNIKRVKPQYELKKVKREMTRAAKHQDTQGLVKWSYIYLDWFINANRVNKLVDSSKLSDDQEQMIQGLTQVFGEQEKSHLNDPVFTKPWYTRWLNLFFSATKKRKQEKSNIELEMNPKD